MEKTHIDAEMQNLPKPKTVNSLSGCIIRSTNDYFLRKESN
jgi:hypothetical protein